MLSETCEPLLCLKEDQGCESLRRSYNETMEGFFLENKIFYLSQKGESPLKGLESYVHPISSIDLVGSSRVPLIIDEEQFSQLDTMTQMNLKSPIFIKLRQLDLKKIRHPLSKIPLAGVIDDKMSSEEILCLIERKTHSLVLRSSGVEPSKEGDGSRFPESSLRGLHLEPRMMVEERSKGQPFLSETSHIFEQALSEICSLCQKWIEECEKGYRGSAHFFEDIQEVKKAAERCQKIIKSLNELSKSCVNSEVCSLGHLVQKTMSLLQVIFESFDWHIDLQGGDDHIWGPPDLLELVISNIVHNACQASDVGASLYVRVYKPRDQFICFEVQDTGKGISEEDLLRIFDPFFTTKSEGVGLGLNLCRKIVYQSGGEIKVDSKWGHGTTFRVEWPLYRE